MNLLIKSVKIIHKDSALNGKVKDIFIKDGIIKKIGDKISEKETGKDVKVFNHKGCCVSIGWFDMKANFRDPGHEMKEDIFSGIAAAKAGGFTGVALMPSTYPTLQTKADVEYVLNKNKNNLTDIFPIGALSVNREGKDLTEMFDMKQAGAVAFTDDKRSVMDAGLMLRALLYAKNIESLIISFADEKNISGKNLMNESVNSVYFGMKGAPSIAEEIMIQRDLKLCEYAGTEIHFSTISSAGAVDLIRKAKKQGLKVTSEIASHQICFDDATLNDYDANFKVKPPFRNKDDIKELIKGLEDGTIDAICSDHSPEDIESKNVEFEFANYGITGLETSFASAHTQLCKKLSIEKIIEKFTTRPRVILNIPVPEIKEGAKANLTIFNPDLEWTFTKDQIKSKSQNTPFINYKLRGKALAVVNNGLIEIMD
ncbi:MAG: dihydroorotase [Bacteroidota bacterium]